MTALAKHIKNAPVGFMQTKEVIEILKGLLMGEKPSDKIPYTWRDRCYNKAAKKQNAKIQEVIDRLGKDK